MKILIATTMYPNKHKPFSGVFIEKHNSILQKNYDIDCIVATGGGSNSSILLIFKKYLFLWLQIIWALLTNKISLIHAHFSYPTGLFAYFGKIFSGKKLIITTHGSDINKHKFQNLISQYLNKTIIRSSDHIIAVSQDLKNKLTNDFNIPKHKISVIDMGVDLKIFNKNIKLEKERTFTFLFIGRLSKEKGFDILLDAIHLLSKNIETPFKCVVIGDGDQRNNYENNVNLKMLMNTISFVGPLNQNKISKWINRSHLVVLPSREEGFGLVAVESLACGTPVIGSDVGGLIEIIIPGKNGYIFPSEHVIELSKTIESFIKNPGLVSPEFCISSVQKFDIQKKVEQVFSIYSNMNSTNV